MIWFCKDSLLGIMVVEKSLFINHDFNSITILNNDFAADFHNFNGDDGLIFYYVFFWFKTCCTILNLLGETLSLDDFVSRIRLHR